MDADTFVLLVIFQSIYYYFWMIIWIKNVNNFQIENIQLEGVA